MTGMPGIALKRRAERVSQEGIFLYLRRYTANRPRPATGDGFDRNLRLIIRNRLREKRPTRFPRVGVCFLSEFSDGRGNGIRHARNRIWPTAAAVRHREIGLTGQTKTGRNAKSLMGRFVARLAQVPAQQA